MYCSVSDVLAVVCLGLFGSVGTKQVVEGVPAGSWLGEQVRAGQFGQQLACPVGGDRGKAGGGGDCTMKVWSLALAGVATAVLAWRATSACSPEITPTTQASRLEVAAIAYSLLLVPGFGLATRAHRVPFQVLDEGRYGPPLMS